MYIRKDKVPISFQNICFPHILQFNQIAIRCLGNKSMFIFH